MLLNCLYRRAKSERGCSEGKISVSLSLLVPCSGKEFVMGGMKFLFISVPEVNIILQQEGQYQSSFDPWRYL